MEQEETYIPYKERTTEELCRDINLRAEKVYLKFSKKDIYCILIAIVALVVCVALFWHYCGHVHGWLLCASIVAYVVVYYVFFRINQKLINDMFLAKRPEQNLILAKRLKKCLFYRHILISIFGFILGAIIAWPSAQNFEWVYFTGCFICLLIGIWLGTIIKPESWVDSDLNEDLYELEYRLYG